MFSTGLLILTIPPSQLLAQLSAHLRAVTRLVNKVLYIKLELGHADIWPTKLYELSHGELNHLAKIIPSVYHYASAYGNIDVRVLQGFTKESGHRDHHLKSAFDIVLTDRNLPQQSVKLYLQNQFQKDCSNLHVLDVQDDLNAAKDAANFCLKFENAVDGEMPKFVVHQNVCLGGTFDRLHNGHKVLLSEALLRCSKKLIVGVTDGDMIKHKTLWEIIEPIDVRISKVKDFLLDVDPTVQYSVVPIYDPFGPAVEDSDLQCIVVSEETKRGGARVNEERVKKGMAPLEMHIVPLLEDLHRNNVEEFKVSSSSHRMRLLGTMLRHPEPKAHLPDEPYLIGLTGGIGSGKSSIGNLMKKLGAGVIVCDKLAHQTYEKGRPVYAKILQEFGQDILKEDGNIDRRKLGAIIFKDEKLRKRLNSLVWPETERMMKEEITRLANEGFKVIVLEVPLLLEAGWADYVHQVWVTLVPEAEAVKRLKQRDNISEEEAKRRIHSQITNKERVECANVVFSTLWEPEYTESQVEKAWKALQTFLEARQQVPNK